MNIFVQMIWISLTISTKLYTLQNLSSKHFTLAQLGYIIVLLLTSPLAPSGTYWILLSWRYRISRTYWLFLAPENAPFWSIQVPKAFLELKGALNAHILDFSGAGNCTFLVFLGTWYLRGLFGVKRGLKCPYFGFFSCQKLHLFGVFRNLIFERPFWS